MSTRVLHTVDTIQLSRFKAGAAKLYTRRNVCLVGHILWGYRQTTQICRKQPGWVPGYARVYNTYPAVYVFGRVDTLGVHGQLPEYDLNSKVGYLGTFHSVPECNKPLDINTETKRCLYFRTKWYPGIPGYIAILKNSSLWSLLLWP